MRGKQINKHIQMEQRRYFAHTIKTHLEINISRKEAGSALLIANMFSLKEYGSILRLNFCYPLSQNLIQSGSDFFLYTIRNYKTFSVMNI